MIGNAKDQNAKFYVAGISAGRLPCRPNTVSVYLSARKIVENFGDRFGHNLCNAKALGANDYRSTTMILTLASLSILIELALLCCLTYCLCCCYCCKKKNKFEQVSCKPIECRPVECRPVVMGRSAEKPKSDGKVESRVQSKTAAVRGASQTRPKDVPEGNSRVKESQTIDPKRAIQSGS